MTEQRITEIQMMLVCSKLGVKLLLPITASLWNSHFTSLGLSFFFNKIIIIVNTP